MQVQKKALPLHPQSRKRFLIAKELGYGVMVTLQILVLPFLVRVRVPQQRKSLSKRLAIFLFIQLSQYFLYFILKDIETREACGLEGTITLCVVDGVGGDAFRIVVIKNVVILLFR